MCREENKFMVSKYEPVGIMIYNNAEFMGVPWEVIVKEYRSFLSDNHKDYILEYANDLYNFILTTDFGFEVYEKKYYKQTVCNFLSEVRENINTKYSKQVDILNRKLDDNEIKLITTEVAEKYYEIINLADDLSDVPKDLLIRIQEKYKDLFEECIESTIGLAMLNVESYEKLKISCNRILNLS